MEAEYVPGSKGVDEPLPLEDMTNEPSTAAESMPTRKPCNAQGMSDKVPSLKEMLKAMKLSSNTQEKTDIKMDHAKIAKYTRKAHSDNHKIANMDKYVKLYKLMANCIALALAKKEQEVQKLTVKNQEMEQRLLQTINKLLNQHQALAKEKDAAWNEEDPAMLTTFWG